MSTEDLKSLLAAPPRIVNVGLATFARDLQAHGNQVVQVDWVPPAGGDAALAGLLAKLEFAQTVAGGEKIAISSANDDAVERMLSADPVLVDVIPAGQAIPRWASA